MSDNMKIFRKLWVYCKNGYIPLGIEYLKSHGILRTIKMTVKVIGQKKQIPVNLGGMFRESNVFFCTDEIEKHTENVDIIICVHNALEDVKQCLESVIRCTQDPYQIIIVDDGSGEETKTFLKSLLEVEQYKGKVQLFINEGELHGYAIAANIGMKKSQGEYLVLLNSDTIVTAGWLDKMIDCAKSDDSIGVVGPLSNTASMQSVPRLIEKGDWCHNDLPEDLSVSDMGQIVKKYSGRIYPQVPLINGFCMLITRKLINQIGYFDEENFGRGFGEEDDFNLRAGKAGFRLAVADNTYIYHAQSKSYSDAVRKELSQKSGVILREKHGSDYVEACVNYMKDNLVLLGIRGRVEAAFLRERLVKNARERWKAKRILFHLPCSEAGGGANVIIQESRKLKEMGAEIAYYNLDLYRSAFEQSYPELEFPVYYGAGHGGFLQYADKFDVICLTYYKGIRYIQPIINDCGKPIRYGYYIQDFEPYFFPKESKDYKEALASYTAVADMICFTKTQWNCQTVKKETGRRCEVIGPSVDLECFRPRRAFGNMKTVRIAAMVRPATPRRAPKMTIEILYELKKIYGAKVEIVIFGCTETEYKEFFLNQSVAFEYEYRLAGKITSEHMSMILSNSDIFVDFSIFQAMGLTAMEAMASGCAVIVPKYGGTSDFAKHEWNCLVTDTRKKEDCIAAARRLIDNPDLRYELASRAITDMCQFTPEACAFRIMELLLA